MSLNETSRGATALADSALTKVRAWFTLIGLWFVQLVPENPYQQYAERELRHAVAHGQERTVLTVVSLAAIAVIGILVVSEIDTALPDPTNSTLNTTINNLITGFGDAMGLVEVVFIVLIAALVLGVVRNFR